MYLLTGLPHFTNPPDWTLATGKDPNNGAQALVARNDLYHAQVRREAPARRSRKRKFQQPVPSAGDLGKQARGGRFRGFGSDASPDFGKIGFRRVG